MVASSIALSCRTWMNLIDGGEGEDDNRTYVSGWLFCHPSIAYLGNLRLMPLVGSTRPLAAECLGDIVRSAPRISHT